MRIAQMMKRSITLAVTLALTALVQGCAATTPTGPFTGTYSGKDSIAATDAVMTGDYGGSD
jgi:hypothetical protein